MTFLTVNSAFVYHVQTCNYVKSPVSYKHYIYKVTDRHIYVLW